MLHPVLTEFQELIDADPVVRMYVNQMIAQVPGTKPYRKRHLDSVAHMVRLINEVLTTAPEFGAHMVATPLGAILDWTMGTPSSPSRLFPSRTTPRRRWYSSAPSSP